ncbi:MAG: UDP-N-acetylglucosamine 2-epimerase (non-hydrolyzing) [Planctomycetes bacterium]|nr:UDP-N-acetylglucosamine 2-epimerase (non-hydrolyzing) [Planctomycetota bacterium]MCB9918042.1 UDP-N-acetylglucosamine 2-epimerase (non-hydrolyzing) [Planctomycetota bacterium]
MKTIAITVGTRPEAIKLAPLVHTLREERDVRVLLVATAQHREILDQALEAFALRPDIDLDVMAPEQSLWDSTARTLQRIGDTFARVAPDFVVVQGDTTSAFAGALAAHQLRIPIGHVEAGLRTGDLWRPHPEEANRRLIARLATLHFAPTESAAANLLREGVPSDDILVTGNTVIDALHWIRARSSGELPGVIRAIESRGGRYVLVTAHRRENLAHGLREIAWALLDLLANHADLEVVFCLHLNPAARHVVHEVLAGELRVHLLPPQPYARFLALLGNCELVMTDSGGIQEEAPAFGKSVVVLRETTERAEAIDAGFASLGGVRRGTIVAATERMLDTIEPNGRARRELFGDGKASQRIAQAVLAACAKR